MITSGQYGDGGFGASEAAGRSRPAVNTGLLVILAAISARGLVFPADALPSNFSCCRCWPAQSHARMNPAVNLDHDANSRVFWQTAMA